MITKEERAEVRNALEQATREPWKVVLTKVGRHTETLIETTYEHPQSKAPIPIVGHGYGLDGEIVYIREQDAELIANAPTWLRQYEDTVTELEGQLEQAVKLLKYYANDYNEHCGNCDQFQTVEGDEDILKFLSQLEKGDNHGS